MSGPNGLYEEKCGRVWIQHFAENEYVLIDRHGSRLSIHRTLELARIAAAKVKA
jgi:hypothetical protein